MTLVPNYVPIDWVDNVTPVDEAKMDHLETNIDQHADAINALDTRLAAEEAMPDIPTVVNGQWLKGSSGAMVWSAIAQADVTGLSAALNAKEATANKGVANGYASLDSGGKVPSSQLPVSIDLRWAGTYAAATAYKEGDVVIYNGVSYMALRPSTGETPAPWSSAAGGALTYLTQTLAADFTLTAATTWQDTGLSLALSVGTWMVWFGGSGQMASSGSGNLATRLNDGTTTYAVSDFYGIAASQTAALPLVATITVASAITLKAQFYSSRNSSKLTAAGVLSPGAGATSLHGIKVA